MAPRMTTILNTLEAPPRYIPNDSRPTLIGLTRNGLDYSFFQIHSSLYHKYEPSAIEY